MSNVGTKSKQLSVHEINKNTKWSVENIDKFQSSDSTTGPLCQENKVLKIADFINYKNAFFVRNTLKRKATSLPWNVCYVKLKPQPQHQSCYMSHPWFSATENYSLWTTFCKVSGIWDMEQASKNPES